MKNRLHVVSFDVPYPPSYGGVIDVFYKVRALHEIGVEVTLHCFRYGRPESQELKKYCKEVIYYSRSRSPWLLRGEDPFIVSSRRSKELLNDLLKDNDPILFEGLHTCGFLGHPALKGRKILVRTHNIEHDYYRALARAENSWLKRQYFLREAEKLEKFESKLSLASHILAISPSDASDLSSRYNNVHHVMAFHSNDKVICTRGTGDFALYHGNLGVAENNQAALFLVNEVFGKLDYPLVIAGNDPSPELKKAAGARKNITLKTGISTSEIDQLISSAQMNVLPTFQATGIKLKLLAALYRGRFCVVNSPMVANTGLESLCVIAEDAPSLRKIVSEYAAKEFSDTEIEARRKALDDKFSNSANARKIAALL